MDDSVRELIYCLSCAVNDWVPEPDRIRQDNLEILFRLAKRHSVGAAVAVALKRAGTCDERFRTAYLSAVRKELLMNVERSCVQQALDQAGIWYVPLKGIVLKDYYPEVGMREMADNDILIDPSARQAVQTIMTSCGFSAKSVGVSNHDVYVKEPIFNFEMHVALFNGVGRFGEYYKDITHLRIKNEDGKPGCHFSDNDFYVYMTAHEYKHYANGGTGLRSLLDCYVFLKAKGDLLDWDYISHETAKLGIDLYESERRELAIHLFSTWDVMELFSKEKKRFEWYLTSGTYGTIEHRVCQQLQGHTRIGYIWHQIWIPYLQMKQSVPWTAMSPVLYPVGIAFRCLRVVALRRKHLRIMFRVLKKSRKNVRKEL